MNNSNKKWNNEININYDKYLIFVDSTNSLFTTDKIDSNLPRLSWFDKYFMDKNSKVFKMNKKMVHGFFISLGIACLYIIAVFAFGFGLLFKNHQIAFTCLSLSSIPAAILIPYFVSRFYWSMYKKEFFALKKIVIDLLDKNIISKKLFALYPESVLVLSYSKKVWPNYKIKYSFDSLDTLVNEYLNDDSNTPHDVKLKKIIKSINNVSIWKMFSPFPFMKYYNYSNILIFCGAIYKNALLRSI